MRVLVVGDRFIPAGYCVDALARMRGPRFGPVSGRNATAVVELTIGLILAEAREADRALREPRAQPPDRCRCRVRGPGRRFAGTGPDVNAQERLPPDGRCATAVDARDLGWGVSGGA